MDKAVRIQLPEDLARELVQADLAIEPFSTRDGPDEVVRLVIEGVTVLANVVTVVTAPEAIRQIVKHLRKFLDRHDQPTEAVKLEGPQGVRSVDMGSDAVANGGAAEALKSALDDVSAEPADE